MKKIITKICISEVTVSNNEEIDQCAWHKKPEVGAYHCSYCCSQCNPICQQRLKDVKDYLINQP